MSMGSKDAALRHTAVGLRALTTVTPAHTGKSASTATTQRADRIVDVITRDDPKKDRHWHFTPDDDVAEDSEPTESPSGHRSDTTFVPGEAFRKDALGKTIAPSYRDVDQGNLADSALLAVCAAVAHTEPAAIIRRVRRRTTEDFFVTLGDDTFVVRPEFSLEGYADPLPNGETDTLWVALIEKAFAAREGDSYAHLESQSASDAFFAFTHKRSLRVSLTPSMDVDHVFSVLREARRAGRAMVLKTHATNVAAPLVADHHFAVLDVAKMEGVTKLRVYNPWGSGPHGGDADAMVHDVALPIVLRDAECIDMAGV